MVDCRPSVPFAGTPQPRSLVSTVHSTDPARTRPDTTSDTVAREIAHEQRFVDTVYARLDAATQSAQALAAEGHGRGRLGHEGGLVERDAMVFQAAKRIAALDAAHEGLVFGRLDLVDGAARYVGRIGLRDAEREVLLVDWRAPAAAVFYQATAAEPAGVVRRRVLRSRGAQVIGLEDDLLDGDAAPEDMVVVGEGALLAQLSRARDSRMHSVVATIQKEQDEAIRAPSRGVTAIGGGPGTGKTVVALHRAAYLLYTERRRFESGGVLVIGPSDVFMGYIDRVLPSLGETNVTLRSLGEVVDGVHASRHDASDVAAVKGSMRMRRVLLRAARDSVAGAPDSFRLFWRDDVLSLDARALRSLRRQWLGGGQQHNRVWTKVRGHLLDVLWRQVRSERGRDLGKQAFQDELVSTDAFTDFADAWWPPLDATQVWTWLHDPQRLTRYAGTDLSHTEVEQLLDSWQPHDPSVQDVPLLDELRYLLGDMPQEDDEVQRDRADGISDELHAMLSAEPRQLMSFEANERRPTTRTEDDSYAHVLLDEAQDLSPMQWRMVGRRGRHASWTVVGDPAQSSWPHPEEAATARAEALASLPVHTFRLSTNYRNSAEVYDFAAKVAKIAAPDPDLPDAVRRTGREPEHRLVAPGAVDEAVRGAVTDMADSVEGTVAVVVPVALRSRVSEQLAEALTSYAGRVSVLGGLDTKGLEFDGVLVVEPAQIISEAEAGWRTLYVVLTRAVQRMVTVGSDDTWLRRVEQAG